MQHKQLSKNFNSQEFDSPDAEFSGLKMNPLLIEMLQKLRDLVDEAIIINSGYRTYKHNIKVRGSVKSSHMAGLAVDIHCVNSSSRFNIIQAAIHCGFERIGIGKNFIHLDIDVAKPYGVVWLY